MTRESLGRVGFVILALAAHAALTSCGGSALDDARATVATTARVAAAADAVAAGVIAERIEAADTLDDLALEERRAGRVVRAFVSVHAALTATDAALDAWATGAAEESTWRDAIACLLPALLGLVDALEAFGLGDAVTEPLRVAVGLLSGFLGGECRAP